MVEPCVGAQCKTDCMPDLQLSAAQHSGEVSNMVSSLSESNMYRWRSNGAVGIETPEWGVVLLSP